MRIYSEVNPIKVHGTYSQVSVNRIVASIIFLASFFCPQSPLWVYKQKTKHKTFHYYPLSYQVFALKLSHDLSSK